MRNLWDYLLFSNPCAKLIHINFIFLLFQVRLFINFKIKGQGLALRKLIVDRNSRKKAHENIVMVGNRNLQLWLRKYFGPIVCYIGEICCCCLQNTQFCEEGVFLQKRVFNVNRHFITFLITMHMHQDSFQEIISNIYENFSFKIFVLHSCISIQSWIFFSW